MPRKPKIAHNDLNERIRELAQQVVKTTGDNILSKDTPQYSFDSGFKNGFFEGLGVGLSSGMYAALKALNKNNDLDFAYLVEFVEDLFLTYLEDVDHAFFEQVRAEYIGEAMRGLNEAFEHLESNLAKGH